MDTITVSVKVFPGSRREKIEVYDEHTYTIYVREDAVRGLVNARVRELLSIRYECPLTSVKLRTGAQSRNKKYSITNDRA